MTYGQSLPPVVRMLLDFIAEKESGGSYQVVYAHKQDKLKKPVTLMTLAELTEAQAWLGKTYGSSAAGRYQHLRPTLLAQVKRLGLPMSAVFSAGLQDDLGWDLLRQRGLDQFLAGKMSVTDFGNSLAKEWASLPVLSHINGKRRGHSYYAGDGLNKAGQTPETFERVLNLALKGFAVSPAAETPPPDLPDAHEDETAETVQPGFRLRYVALAGLLLGIILRMILMMKG